MMKGTATHVFITMHSRDDRWDAFLSVFTHPQCPHVPPLVTDNRAANTVSERTQQRTRIEPAEKKEAERKTSAATHLHKQPSLPQRTLASLAARSVPYQTRGDVEVTQSCREG